MQKEADRWYGVVGDHTQQQMTDRYSVQNLGVCIHVAVGYVVFSQTESFMNT